MTKKTLFRGMAQKYDRKRGKRPGKKTQATEAETRTTGAGDPVDIMCGDFGLMRDSGNAGRTLGQEHQGEE